MLSELLSELRYRIRALVRRPAMEAELDDELRFHLERETEKLIRAGVAPDEAARRAKVAFGGLDRIKEDSRDARGLVALETTMQDIRYAFRGLRARKTFTAGIVLTLALGVGANATMFGIVDRLLFRPPPMMNNDDLVHRVYMHTNDRGEIDTRHNFQFARYLDVLRFTRSFSSVAAFQTRDLAIGEKEAAAEMPVTIASASYFDFFDVRPALGRLYGPAEDSVPTGAPVVMLGYAFWQTRFGGRPDVIGEQLRVDRALATIIGVAPEGFVGMTDQQVPAAYLPITHYAYAFRGASYPGNYNWSWLEMIAKRRPGVDVASAETDLTQALQQSWRAAVEFDPGWGPVEQVQPRAELGPVHLERGPNAGRESRVATWIAGVAIIVLLVACANVANLLLSRAVSRRREIAMRVALGVSRGRLLRQLLIESLILAGLGGLAGLAITQWGASGLRALFLPPDYPAGVFTDGRTLWFAGGLTLIVAMLTSIVPALHSRRIDLAGSLKAGSREGTYRSSRTGTALLVFQAALSVVLLVGAGLFVRSLQNVQDYRLGYDVEPVLFASANPRGTPLKAEELDAMNQRMLDAAKELPGVTNSALAASVPFWSNEGRGLYVAGIDTVDKHGMFIMQAATPDYFATVGTRILRGRSFGVEDTENAPLVTVVSDGMAAALWPGQDAIGQCIRIGSDTVPCSTVIGIAEEARLRTLMGEREYSYYVPATQYGDPMYPQMFVRVAGDASALVEPLRQRLQREMPGEAYVNVVELSQLVDPNLRGWRFGATMFVVFGAIALVLAAIGLYSMIAYSVAQRTRELGVRVALGASASDVLGLIVRGGVRLALAGILIGGAIALWAAPRLESLMFEVSTRDPLVFGGVAVVLLASAIAASVVPAVRALRLDPNAALRAE